MPRLGGLLVVLAAAFAGGCSIDRIEWESTGFPIEEVTLNLREEHGVQDPKVECIKREVGGAVWECRAAAGSKEEFECEVKVGVREKIRSLVCELRHAEKPIAEE